MHPDEVRIDESTMRALLRRQAPQWADLPITALPADIEGTDHTLFRIGDDLLARMPKIGWAADQAVNDATWLAKLAPHVDVALPIPVHLGDPEEDFPFPWSVTRWLPGRTLGRADRGDLALAEQLAAFVADLESVPTTDGPPPKSEGRGTDLAGHDEGAQRALARLAHHDDGVEVAAAARAWELCRDAEISSTEVWIHGDLQPGNLLVAEGRLAAVIDWGAIGVADPAPDLAAAFWTFEGAARTRFRELLGHDEAAWLRALGWTLLPALTGVHYYRTSAPHMAQRGREHIATVLAELGL